MLVKQFSICLIYFKYVKVCHTCSTLPKYKKYVFMKVMNEGLTTR